MTDSLLPDNRTPLERAMEKTLRDAIAQIGTALPFLWRPDDVDVAHIPWLAEGMGADEWDSDDSESEKRANLKTLWARQRQAGMAIALKRAVEPLGIGAEVVPWYRSGGEPYSLEVRAFAGEETLDGETQERLLGRVKKAASERDVVTMIGGVKTDQNLNLGGFVRPVIFTRLEFSDA